MFDLDVNEIRAPMNDAAESSCPPPDILGCDGARKEPAEKIT